MIKRYWWVVTLVVVVLAGWWGYKLSSRLEKNTKVVNNQNQQKSQGGLGVTGVSVTPVLEDVLRVVNWQASSGSLLVGRAGGDKIIKILVSVPKTRVIIPIIRRGKPIEEVVMQQDRNEWWRLAFCGGDEIEVSGLGEGWDKLASGQVIRVERIRNLGPRKCVN